MRHIELLDDHIRITLTGLTKIGALQGHLTIPYENIVHVHDHLEVPRNLLRVGGTALGSIQEGHYIGTDGWYFLSYENPTHVVTLDLANFRLGRQTYVAVAIEVDNPDEVAKNIAQKVESRSSSSP